MFTMVSFATLKEVFSSLFFPWYFMYISLTHLPATISSLVASRDFGTLFWPPALAEALFGNFWATVGPNVKQSAEVRVVPLLEGRVTEGRILDDVVGEPVRGTVLEIGAGSGMWMDVFAKFVDTSGGAGGGSRRRTRRSAAHSSGITKIYGVEPNATSATALRQRVRDLGLEEVYEVAEVGIEDLNDPEAWKEDRIEPGSVDCIVTVLCLCSIPEPEENIQRLYELLRPGGRWYVYEHVKAQRGGWPIRFYQSEWCSPFLPYTRPVADVAYSRICKLLLVYVYRLLSSLSLYGEKPAQCWTMAEDRSCAASKQSSIRGAASHLRDTYQVMY